MNGISKLPGFEALLREHKRLATKLTSDELRAIRDYIEDRVHQEHADVNFRLYALQNDFDVTVRKSSETITNLYQELREKNDIIKKYQNSDSKISNVYKQKEARWEKKQELLVTEIQKLEGEATRCKTQVKHMEEELRNKTKDNENFEEKLEDAKDAIEMLDEARSVVKERDDTRQEMLKLKMDLDKKDRQIINFDREINLLKGEKERYNRDKQMNDMKVKEIQNELRAQMVEVAEKCKSLSELQFQLQMEHRQVETLQKELKHATHDLNNYKQMLEAGRPALSPSDPTVLILKKDLDIMDIRIKSLDIGVRMRSDDIKKVEERVEDIISDERLATQMKSEIYLQGDTYLELTSSELAKRIETRHKRLNEELRFAKDWDHNRREADMLRSEISAMIKQASICKLSELGSRAAKQLQKIDLIMRGTNSSTKMPNIYKVSERRPTNESRNVFKPKSKHQTAFISASTPINGQYDMSGNTRNMKARRKITVGKGGEKLYRYPVLENHTDDTKLQYYDTAELDLSSSTPSLTHRRHNQSDRMTIKSVSTTTIDAIAE